MKPTTRFRLAAALLAAFALPFVAGCGGDAPAPAAAAEEVWTCSMHPQIQLPGPGQCPICGMDLIKRQAGTGAEHQLAMTAASVKLAEIVTRPAERRAVEVERRFVGKITFDEARVRTITAWVAGRIDRVFVDVTGIRVEERQHLVEVYSPELYAAQEELLQARRALAAMADSRTAATKAAAEQSVEAARTRLRLWGLAADQIAEVERRDRADTHVTIRAPLGGVVVTKNALEGMYVQMGSPLYTIADLSVLWLELQAYESDLPWLHAYQPVEFEVEALPGERFPGRVVLIDPVLTDMTRTVRVRVIAPNDEGRLKPGMFAHAVVRARLDHEGQTGGPVLDPSARGQWVCPMHPEILRPEGGPCPWCGMDLVPVEQTVKGADQPPPAGPPPLVIPSSAPLLTGRRAVVYVRVPGAEQPTFEQRDVTLGPRAGDWYVIRAGLKEGEQVVVQGNFKIDSAMQIAAKPSMMSRPGDEPLAAPEPPPAAGRGVRAPTRSPAPTAALRAGVQRLYDRQRAAQEALAAGAFEPARAALAAWAAEVVEVAPPPVEPPPGATEGRGGRASPQPGAAGPHARAPTDQPAPPTVAESLATQAEALAHAAHATDLAALRGMFRKAARALLALADFVPPAAAGELTLIECPMDDEGGPWLQKAGEVMNPYYGPGAMQHCGEQRRGFAPAAATPTVRPEPVEGRTEQQTPAVPGHDHGAPTPGGTR